MVWLVLLDFSQGDEPIFVSNCSWSMPSFKETVLLVLNFKMEAGATLLPLKICWLMWSLLSIPLFILIQQQGITIPITGQTGRCQLARNCARAPILRYQLLAGPGQCVGAGMLQAFSLPMVWELWSNLLLSSLTIVALLLQELLGLWITQIMMT